MDLHGQERAMEEDGEDRQAGISASGYRFGMGGCEDEE